MCLSSVDVVIKSVNVSVACGTLYVNSVDILCVARCLICETKKENYYDDSKI